MPSRDHEVTGIAIRGSIIEKIALIAGNSKVSELGTTTFQLRCGSERQGDQCIWPRSRYGPSEWPTVMLEVGYSQTLASLQHDAVTWLDNSFGQIKFVILAKIKRNPRSLRIQCWKICPTGHRRARQTRSEMPTCDQDFDINYAGVVTSRNGSTQLTIPYNCIFDDIPTPQPLDVVFTFAELSSMGQSIFKDIECKVLPILSTLYLIFV